MKTARWSRPWNSGSVLRQRAAAPADRRPARPSRIGLAFLTAAAALLAPGPSLQAARGPIARAILRSPGGETEELELTRIRFVHYRRRLAQKGKWGRSGGVSRPSTQVTIKPVDDRYESRYLQWNSEDPGVRLNTLCEIRVFYQEGDGPGSLYLQFTSKKGRTTEKPVLELLGAHQPRSVHFAGKVVKGKKRDFPLPPLRSDQPPTAATVLDRILFYSRKCPRD